MPLVDGAETVQPFEGAASEVYKKPTLLDQMGAAIERENSIGAAFSSRGALPSERTGVGDYGFNLEDHLTPEEKSYRASFTMARSEDDVTEIRKRVAGERKSMAALADGPLPQWLAITTAGVFDPINALPAFGPLTRTGSAAVSIGSSVLFSTAAQEFALSQRQYERSASESAASIITSAVFGAALGGLVGSMAKDTAHIVHPPQGLTQDIASIIRSTGLTGPPRPRAELMSTTAVGRFMDRIPEYRAGRPAKVDLPNEDLLNALTHENPSILNRINNATDNVARLEARAAQLEPRNRIDRLAELNARRFGIESVINDLEKFKQTTEDLKTYVDPAEVARITATREELLAKYPAFAENVSGREKLLRQALDDVNEKKKFYSDASETANQKDLELARVEQENANLVLANKLHYLRATLDAVGEKLGPSGKAAVAADILRHRDTVAAALEAGKPFEAPKKPNYMDWLKGIAANPQLSEAIKTEVPEGFKAFEKSKKGAESVSAASVHGLDKRMSQLATSHGVAQVMAKLKKVGLAAPSLELSTSIFDAARRAVQKIVDTGMTTVGNTMGFASPLSMATEIKRMAEADIYAIGQLVEAGWKDYKAASKSDVRPMTKKEFLNSVAYAMRRGDKHADEFVQDLAKELRKFDDKYKELAKEWKVGVFKDGDPGVGKTAESHFYRAYNVAVLKARYAEFIEMASEYFAKRGIADAKMKFKNGILHDKDGHPVDIADDPRAYADEAAQAVYNKIMSFPESRLPPELKVSVGRGAAKERTFNIPDAFVSEKGTRFEDFLDNNPINVMSRYVKTLASDVAFEKTMGGTEGLEDILKELRDEASDMAKEAKSPKDSARIIDQMKHEAELIQRLTEQVRGTNGKPMDSRMEGFNRVLKSVRGFNVLRSLGSVIFSQLPDTGTLIMSEGMTRVFGTIIADAVHGFKGTKLGIAEGRRLGTATDMSMMGRSGALMDLGERYRNVSAVETGIDTAAHYAMIGFGLAPWTVGIKGVASYLGGDSILRGITALAEGGKISDRLRTTLARDGIGLEEARRIYAQKDNFVKHNGLWMSNAQSWTDTEAQNLFGSALVRRVDNAVITPNAGDAPLWTSTEIGKTLFQFKRFAWASNQRTLIAGMQLADIETLNGMLAMMGLALLGTVGRDVSQKGQVDPNRTTAGWAREMVDRSGIVSQFMEGDALLDKATGGHGLTRMLTGAQAQRFSSTGLLERAGGPTVGLLADTSKALSGVADGTLTGSDIHNIRRLFPIQNFPATRMLFDQMEQNVVQELGLPPRQIK